MALNLTNLFTALGRIGKVRATERASNYVLEL